MSAEILLFPNVPYRDAPDADCVTRDALGQQWRLFMVDFEIDGGQFNVEIWAVDFADAERRVEALRATARLAGQVMAREPS